MGQGPIFDRQTKVLGEVSLASDLIPDEALQTVDARGNDLLEQILTELKITNMHLSIMTDNHIEEKDID